MELNDDDGLCEACSKVDLFSLFTGPRRSTDSLTPTESQTYANVGTLHEVLANTTCPLCRLVKHDILGRHDKAHKMWRGHKEPDPTRVQCYLRPYRADYSEDTTYINRKTRDQVATIVQVCVRSVEGCCQGESDLIQSYIGSRCGLQLLSPDSIDASRPLMNGYQATTLARSLELLSGCIQTCQKSHKRTCGTPTWNQQPGLESIRLIDVAFTGTGCQGPRNFALYRVALSYVWGKNTEEYLKLANETQFDVAGSLFLPPRRLRLSKTQWMCAKDSVFRSYGSIYTACINMTTYKKSKISKTWV